MQFLRRFGAPLGITVLVGLSVLVLVSVGEGFKFLVNPKEGFALWKRDGGTVTFTLPWKSALETASNAKALSEVDGNLLGDVTIIASAILDAGSNIASNDASQGAALQSKAAVDIPTTQVSVIFDGGANVVASILSEVNNVVNDATGIIGGVVSDATSVIGMIIGVVTSTANSQSTSASNQPVNTSEPQELLSQSHSTSVIPAANSALNITSAVTLHATQSSSAAPAAAPCPVMITTTIMPCCPPPSTSIVSCTVTETWHSTHYESTQTLYSFMSVFTITCTETVSVCPPYNPYVFAQNSTIPSSNPSLMTCSNGVTVKRQEDCPPASTASQPSNSSAPCTMMMAGSTTSYHSRNPILSVASLMSNTLGNASLPNTTPLSVPSTMASFTASPPNLISTALPASTIASLTNSIICADGSLVIQTQDCLNGLSGSPFSLLAFRTSPMPIASQIISTAVANTAGSGNNMLSNMVANVISALSNVQGLTGDMLGTVIADFTSVIQAANTLTGNTLPTDVALAVAGPATAAAGGIVQTISENANATARAGNEFVTGGNVHSHLETVVNSGPTLLPIVTTEPNGKATTVSIVDMMVDRVPTVKTAVNDGAGLLAGLETRNPADTPIGGTVGALKGRRRTMNRDTVEEEVDCQFEEKPMDEPCLLYVYGGGLVMEREALQ